MSMTTIRWISLMLMVFAVVLYATVGFVYPPARVAAFVVAVASVAGIAFCLGVLFGERREE